MVAQVRLPDPHQETNLGTFLEQIKWSLGASRKQLRNYCELHAWSTDPETAFLVWRQLFLFKKLKDGVVPTKTMR
jgi:hypothetical protein